MHGYNPLLAGKWHKSSLRRTQRTPYPFLAQKWFICTFLLPWTIKSQKLMRFVLGTKFGWEWWVWVKESRNLPGERTHQGIRAGWLHSAPQTDQTLKSRVSWPQGYLPRSGSKSTRSPAANSTNSVAPPILPTNLLRFKASKAWTLTCWKLAVQLRS